MSTPRMPELTHHAIPADAYQNDLAGNHERRTGFTDVFDTKSAKKCHKYDTDFGRITLDFDQLPLSILSLSP